jgi:hypothetical protein
MNLSIVSANTYQGGHSAGARKADTADPRQPSPPSPGSETPEHETSTADSEIQHPAPNTHEASRLTPEEQRQINELQQRDRDVKAHELAHKSVGGRYVTGGSFTYQTGPDGRRYAIGGEVTLDSSPGGTPRETLSKAELIRRAALAPADPSPQDYRVASQANLMAVEARGEMAAQQRVEAMARREALRDQTQAAEEDKQEINPQRRRAIASFEAVSGITRLATNPDPIDELI